MFTSGWFLGAIDYRKIKRFRPQIIKLEKNETEKRLNHSLNYNRKSV
jgi:hypothetical protein